MKLPIVRIVFHNAFILSVIYLLTGIAIDTAWWLDPFKGHLWAEHLVFRLSLAIDALPAQVLHLLGLLPLIQSAYAAGTIREVGLRWIFEITTLVVILVTAFAVALLMALTRRLWEPKDRTA